MKFSPDRTIQRDKTVLFVGRLLPHKGINYLIEALPPGLRLEVVGPALYEQYLEDLHKLAARKCVTFHTDFDDAAPVAHYLRAMCITPPRVYPYTPLRQRPVRCSLVHKL